MIGDRFDSSQRGAAWVFTRSESTWTQQGPKLTGGSEEFSAARFGYTLALSADGNTALIGAAGNNKNRGIAEVFTRSESTWTQQATLGGGSEEVGEGHFGCCGLALSADGNIALIGAYADANQHGAAWLFTRSGSSWTQQGPKLTGASEVVGGKEIGRPEFGWSAALSSEGNSALIGAPSDNNQMGAAWALENLSGPQPEVTSVAPKLDPATGGTTVTITGNNLAEASAVWFGSLKAPSFTVNSPSSITAVSPEAPAATIHIFVRTPTGGVSPAASTSIYKFDPTITAVSPNTGPTAGGTSVTVTGAGFGLGTKATIFKFGSTVATSVNCVSSTECTLVSPAHTAGKVTVKATVNKLTSVNTNAAHFTYE